VIPAGFDCHEMHAVANDGTPIAPTVYDEHQVIPRR